VGKNLAEKILQKHSPEEVKKPGQIIPCRVSLVLANDITAPLAVDSFRKMQAPRVFDADKIALVCDHFTPNKDIASAEQVQKVRLFAREMNITHYYEGGNVGVEHALLPELGLVGPGDVVVGADSHTCTYGGLGAFATGMGSTDIAAAMALGETWFKIPETIRVNMNGSLDEFTTSKDLILNLIGRIKVDGALYRALEFAGETLAELDAEARMTMANMAIEAGGKAGLFPVDQVTLDYCREHGRLGDDFLEPDQQAGYCMQVDMQVSGMPPQVACPHLPDNVAGVDDLQEIKVDQVVLGSCTNGRISDLRQAAQILKDRKVDKNVRLIVLPATPKIFAQALEEGLLEIFLKAGGIIGPPTCGPCLGGHMGILASGETCLATTNRNFKGRMGSLESKVYLGSPYVAAATAIAGRIIHPARV